MQDVANQVLSVLLALATFAAVVGIIAAHIWALVDAARKRRAGWVVALALIPVFALIPYLIVRPGPAPYEDRPPDSDNR